MTMMGRHVLVNEFDRAAAAAFLTRQGVKLPRNVCAERLCAAIAKYEKRELPSDIAGRAIMVRAFVDRVRAEEQRQLELRRYVAPFQPLKVSSAMHQALERVAAVRAIPSRGHP